jgi:hypothetical protein
VIAVEAGNHLQLFELLGVAIEGGVQIRELLARRHQAGRHRDRFLELLQRVSGVSLLAEAEAQQILRVGLMIVEPQRVFQRAVAPLTSRSR